MAKQRWKILKRALLSSDRHVDQPKYCEGKPNRASVRRFSSFELFKVSNLSSSCAALSDDDAGENLVVNWFQYEYQRSTLKVSARVCVLMERATVKEMMGFNNTGNVCIWPSEEVMAFFCLENASLFSNACVCELGAGMTGLAGVLLACTSMPREVLLTDGNPKSVENMRKIVKMNSNGYGEASVSVNVLTWDPSMLDCEYYSQFKHRFDAIICADCLFFLDLHIPLLQVMSSLLKPQGVSYVFAPARSGSLEKFCTFANDYFIVERREWYLDEVQLKHDKFMKDLMPIGMYDPDIHYPQCLMLHLKLK